jgi:hypothetical protein
LVAAWNSAIRPAAMTAIAVQKLARADSVSIGFIGCGVQARSHFDVLRLVLPDLKEVVACSRSAASAERFVAMVRGAGRFLPFPGKVARGLRHIIGQHQEWNDSPTRARTKVLDLTGRGNDRLGSRLCENAEVDHSQEDSTS